jgi:formate-dependent nitrite reductase membrane component NrfD
MKKSSALFTTAIAIAIVTIILGVYYLIPHIYHPYVFMSHPFQLINHPLVNYNAHKKYTAIFFGIALIALVGAFLVRPKKVAAVNS